MEVFHKVFSNGNAQFKQELDLLGFSYKYEENIMGKIVIFEIAESHPQWHIIKEIASRHNVCISQSIVYSKKEIAEAEWLALACTGHFGYPQPEDDYVPYTYDTSDYCERCGIGGNQKTSFHFRAEPKAKRSHFFQLNWVFDEFFVKPEVKLIFQQNAVSGIFSNALDVVKSAEWFGSGAFRAVIVSRKVADIILEKEWRGIALKPIRLSDASQQVL
jgi:hypothetical protein